MQNTNLIPLPSYVDSRDFRAVLAFHISKDHELLEMANNYRQHHSISQLDDQTLRQPSEEDTKKVCS
jgi:hypothetical protein